MQSASLMVRSLLLAGAFTLPLLAQSAWQPAHHGIGFGQPQPKQSVQLASSSELTTDVTRPAAQRLEFSIDPGMHINSHTPKSHFLIPTTLTLDAPVGVEVAKVDYPQGVDYHFDFAPKDALSVYTGQFAVMVHLHAKPGHYTIHGQLRYQACDSRACNPPRTLPLTLDVTAK
ncbi:MAG: protein-disulfide reductase DsbD domain-containing protein [Acidobacteriaceae bacterium]